MATAGYVDATGIHTPTYQEILDELKATYRTIFGADVYLDADGQEGQMLAMFALAIYDANQLAVSVYNAFSPQTAQGTGLSRMVKINGIMRQPSSKSTADVTIVGTAGTIITNGIVQDIAAQKWDLPTTVTVPVGGSIVVTVTAQDDGDIQAAIGDINEIVTPTRGWLSVTNAAAATPGDAVETDGELRARQTVSTALPSETVLEGIVGAVANVSGVSRFKGYENDTDATDGDGIPAHHIAIVADGGTTENIANAIATKKTPGTGTYGTTTYTTTDKYGVPNDINFYRPTDAPITIELAITARAGYVSTTGTAIKANLAAYLNGLDIGDDVLLSKLYTPINNAEPDANKRTFDVTSLLVAKGVDTPAAANITISFIEAATCSVDDITITVS